MFIKRFVPSFRQLQGKLTLSYTLTAVVTFLVVEMTGIPIVFWFISGNVPSFAERYLRQQAEQATPFCVDGLPGREVLTSWLRVVNTNLSEQRILSPDGAVFLAVVDTQGQTIASTGVHPVSFNTSIQEQLSSRDRANLRAVLNDREGRTSTADEDADGTIVAITPIVGKGKNILGGLVMKIARPDRLWGLTGFLQIIVLTVTIVTIIAAIGGMVFGYLTARSLTRRLRGLSAAADRWSRGDFSSPVYDASGDELGQVARQLNRMAEQLQNLLQTRQKLATLEERNRLARDLHDSVKQQVFTLAMQIGATKVLLKRDVGAAEERLNEAQKLVTHAQRELTSLIRELRPVALEGKGLAVALRELVTEWTQQTDIVANLRVEGTQTLPLTVEEALFRVAQEALANVARHSKATLVQLLLTVTNESVTLSVIDNGQGFDTTRHKHLGVGLLSMQERMRALGGDVQIESTSRKGTHVIACCKQASIGTGNATVACNDLNIAQLT
jgi:NarL family two-component system sensor histidine kinase LiaS